MEEVTPEAENRTGAESVESVPEDTPPVSQETPAVETQSAEVDQLPEDKSEQGRAFQEMRHKLKEMERQLAQRPAGTEQPTTLLPRINNSSPEVAREVRQVLSEQKAWDKYPQLNPESDKYDPAFAKRVTRMAAMDIVERGEADIYSVAEEEAKLYYGRQEVEKVQKETEKKVKEQLTEKEQAALTVTGNPPSKSKEDTDYERIVYLSRHGTEDQKIWARAERLKRAGV